MYIVNYVEINSLHISDFILKLKRYVNIPISLSLIQSSWGVAGATTLDRACLFPLHDDQNGAQSITRVIKRTTTNVTIICFVFVFLVYSFLGCFFMFYFVFVFGLFLFFVFC